MYKRINYLFIVSCLAVLLSNCAGTTAKGTLVKGKFKDASDLRIFLDKISVVNKKVEILKQGEINGSGKYSIDSETPLEAGIYRLRVGSHNTTLVLNGTEKVIDVSGSLLDMDNGMCTITGSPLSVSVNKIAGDMFNHRIGLAEIKQEAKKAEDPMVSMFLSMAGFSGTKEEIEDMKEVVTKMRSKYPKSVYTTDLDNMIASIERSKLADETAAGIGQGKEAPNISMPNPDGKVIELKSLRGKVVLLDFWASWCGPCRRENPNVVRVYNKYKDKGFTVYSVSLDRPGGLDNWKQAIAADGLIWPNHVSDLQHWNSAAGRMYGIQSIPSSFLLDRDGKIIGQNLRGEQLEPAVQKAL